MNLLMNAIQAIDDRGTITLSTSVADKTVDIAIKDTGVGMSSEQLGNLYDPRLSTKGPRVKAQLGLFACYSIVHKHRGQIIVDSEIGRGTRFTVSIPLDLDGEDEVRL
jgi:signal transduction histidine kinase